MTDPATPLVRRASTLSAAGRQRMRALRVVLEWLGSGGDVAVGSHGHRILMTDDARPGFLARRGDGTELLLQVDSPDVWAILVDHASRMTDEDVMEMAANTALCEINRKERE